MSESTNMTFGPVQMLVVGFAGTEFTGEIMQELQRLKEADIVRLVDMIVVRKQDGQVETVQASDLSVEEAENFGALVGALIGAGMGEEEGVEAGLIAGAEAGADGHVIDEDQVWYLADAVPEGKPPRSPCSSTAGRSRFATRSSRRTGWFSRTPGSTRPTWSRSARWRPRRPAPPRTPRSASRSARG